MDAGYKEGDIIEYNINRITVEFKYLLNGSRFSAFGILIESQWNLNSLISLKY